MADVSHRGPGRLGQAQRARSARVEAGRCVCGRACASGGGAGAVPSTSPFRPQSLHRRRRSPAAAHSPGPSVAGEAQCAASIGRRRGDMIRECLWDEHRICRFFIERFFIFFPRFTPRISVHSCCDRFNSEMLRADSSLPRYAAARRRARSQRCMAVQAPGVGALQHPRRAVWDTMPASERGSDRADGWDRADWAASYSSNLAEYSARVPGSATQLGIVLPC